ncbi:hypothetical protein HPB52_024746 [Rhipicephalus sanguineus]|uniref:F-box domain-containing protein n=1 Tax=Rhipicephalus sanguineus TaxID=34632 RepID=A0A9D4PA36_RHISA|nr:hypothetical protein HPB52_024746 [Rhipicephalus sanguineus]
MQQENDSLLRLPDHLLGAILELLEWKQRQTLANTCRRLRNLVNGAQWLRCARFTLQDTPAVFTSLMVPPITDIIVELDVRFYVTAKQEQLVKAISQCTNLVVLRCVHSRILSMSVVLLLWKKLRRLECLHWSVSEVKAVSVKASDFTAENSEDSARCDCSIMPPKLKSMYVEVVSTVVNENFICLILRHCHALKSLHFHERESISEPSRVSSMASEALRAYREGTDDRFEEFTYTADRTPTDAVLPKNVAVPQDFADFGLGFEVHKSVTLRMVPSRSRSWVSLAELDSVYAENATKHAQLTVFIGDFQCETMNRLNEWWRGNKFRLIRCLAIVPASGVAASIQCTMRNQSSLCNFLRSCIALVELNLSAFHFRKNFNWSSLLATGGLHNIRSLALAACALCRPEHLQLLGGASFKLRELDVRFFPQEAPNCVVCLLATTCDDVALAPLRSLNHLERLTLCELSHARSLRFLLGCASIRELRLRNMGVWCKGSDQDIKPLVSLWPRLRVAKFEGATSFDNFNVFFGMPAAPLLKRLCLTGHSAVLEAAIDLQGLLALQQACPALDIVHVHVHCPVAGVAHRFFPRHPFLLDDNVPDLDDPLWLPTADKVWLCDCSNFIGLTAPHGVKFY